MKNKHFFNVKYFSFYVTTILLLIVSQSCSGAEERNINTPKYHEGILSVYQRSNYNSLGANNVDSSVMHTRTKFEIKNDSAFITIDTIMDKKYDFKYSGPNTYSITCCKPFIEVTVTTNFYSIIVDDRFSAPMPPKRRLVHSKGS